MFVSQIFLRLAGTLAAVAAEASLPSGQALITPHQSFSSSVGVLGCKINASRVAYWPLPVDCDDICVRVDHQGRELVLLRVDRSASAFDISYDAWNLLGFGVSAAQSPKMGGGILMNYTSVPIDECLGLLDGGTLPLSAANSMNFLHECLQKPESFVARYHKLYNIFDPTCRYGKDEVCTRLVDSNQPQCPSGLGVNTPLNLPIGDIQYGFTQ